MRSGIVVSLALLAAAAPWPGDAAGDSRRPPGGGARIAAGDVRDRETLRAFVEGAKEYLAGMTTLSEVAELRDLFRAEGAWRSGSLFPIKLLPNATVLLHGADPTADSKDVSALEDESGVKVVRELLAAAARGGGFATAQGTARSAGTRASGVVCAPWEPAADGLADAVRRHPLLRTHPAHRLRTPSCARW